MKRIHPEFGKAVYEGCKNDDMAAVIEKSRDAVQYWSDTLTREIGPQAPCEMPFIIAAMKNIVAAYNKLAPGSENVADNIMVGMKTDVFAVRL